MKYWISVFCIFTYIFGFQGLKIKSCPCDDEANCKRVAWPRDVTQAYVVTNGKSSYKEWQWDHISMVLAKTPSDPKLMCHAHGLNKGYGFFVTVPDMNTSSPEFTNFLEETQSTAKNLYADAVVLDLLELTGKCNANEHHIANITDAVGKIHDKIRRSLSSQIVCVMPWKPPCYNNNCDLTKQIKKYCDRIVTSPDSFITFCGLSCKARATVPKSKLVLGLDEYLSNEISEDNLMVGIPWHGYDYTCNTFKQTISGVDICTISKRNDSSGLCDYENNRQRRTLGYIMDNYPRQFEKYSWNGRFAAPYFDYHNMRLNETHQVWFEGFDSLTDKYSMVKEMKLRGVVVFTADDLSNKEHAEERNGVWFWMVHNLFFTGEATHEKPTYFAGQAAGIGVGCFLAGCLLGFAVTCIATRRNVKNLQLRRPFDKDLEDINGDTYHDDENL